MRPSSAAARLLAGLATNGSYAVADPTASGSVILRSARAGVSLGGGRFKATAADALVSRDLARWTTAQGRRRIEITDAGRAYLRRGVAGTAQEGFLAQHLTLTAASWRGAPDPFPSRWTQRRARLHGSAGARTRTVDPSSTMPRSPPASACASTSLSGACCRA